MTDVVEEILARFALPPELEAEVRLGGRANGLALRVQRGDAGAHWLEVVRLPAELREDVLGERPNEIPDAVVAAIVQLVRIEGATGDDALIASDALELPLLSTTREEGQTFAHGIGPW